MRLRLHHRIVLPFAAVAIVATAAVAWMALSVTSSTVTAYIRQDVVSATTAVSRSDYALNPAILVALKQVAGADVLTFGPDGPIATTLQGEGRGALIDRVIGAVRGAAIPAGEAVVLELRGTPSYYAAYREVAGRPGVVVALIHENAEVVRANRTIGRTILGTAAVSLLAMLIVSQFVSRRVTLPIERLAAFAQDVSAAETPGRAPVGDDEVGRLGAAFNDMLERLDQAQAALVKSEKLSLAGLFAARVAHDVRNPLSSIKMQTQLLQSHLQPGTEGREMTEAMLQDITQVEFVVKDLLELARPGELRRAPRQLNEILAGVIRQVTPQCRHRGIGVQSNLAADLPVMSLDADRLTQAVLNVVVNAMEALREGGTLSVSSRLSADGAVVEIDDDGVGLEAASAGRVFDPFVSTKPGGVGLGLVNARAAIESHGGTIVLASRMPTGTRATITLPRALSLDGVHG